MSIARLNNDSSKIFNVSIIFPLQRELTLLFIIVNIFLFVIYLVKCEYCELAFESKEKKIDDYLIEYPAGFINIQNNQYNHNNKSLID